MKKLSIVLLLAAGCGHFGGHAMTPAEVSGFGTRAYDAPPTKVFKAVVQALELEGYKVPVQNLEKGLVRTARKVIRADAVGGNGYAMAVDVSRQYYVDLKQDPSGKTVVIAQPRVYRGETDLSDGEVWVLEGADGERALWSKLFRDIGDQL
jgi:hypothetical protein